MSREDGKCNRCRKDGGAIRHSFGVYAGFLCYQCAWDSFIDHCGLAPEGQGSAADLDEPVEPEPSSWPDGDLDDKTTRANS
jgi:hypothetical protein